MASRPIRKTIAPTALDRNGIAAAQSVTGAFTLDGVLVSGGVVTFTTPQHVTVYAPGDEATDTITITGTDLNGNAMTEDITGVNAGTVAGTKNFSTVTAVSSDGAVVDMEIGVDGTAEGPWWPLGYTYPGDFNVGVGMVISTGATLTYSLQHTYDDVYAKGFDPSTAAAFTHATIAAKSANFEGTITSPVSAVRVAITAHTSGSVTANIIQSGQ